MKICSSCGYNQITGTEEFCPQCNVKLTYKCKKCGKELINGKKSKCPLCIGKTKRLIGIILTCCGTFSCVPGILLSILYLANPLDLIPDPTPVVGIIDDIIIILAAILLCCGSLISGLVFLVWGIIIVVKLSEKKKK